MHQLLAKIQRLIDQLGGLGSGQSNPRVRELLHQAALGLDDVRLYLERGQEHQEPHEILSQWKQARVILLAEQEQMRSSGRYADLDPPSRHWLRHQLAACGSELNTEIQKRKIADENQEP